MKKLIKKSGSRVWFKAFSLLCSLFLLPSLIEGRGVWLYEQNFEEIGDAHQTEVGKVTDDSVLGNWAIGAWHLLAEPNLDPDKYISPEARLNGDLGNRLDNHRKGIGANAGFHLLEATEIEGVLGLEMIFSHDNPYLRSVDNSWLRGNSAFSGNTDPSSRETITSRTSTRFYSRHDFSNPDAEITLNFDLFTNEALPVQVRVLLEHPDRIQDPSNGLGSVWEAFSGSVTNDLPNTYQRHSLTFHAFGEEAERVARASSNGGFAIDSMRFQITSNDWGYGEGNEFRLDNIEFHAYVPPKLGDVNRDSRISLNDLVLLNNLIIYDALVPIPADPPENAEELGLPTDGWSVWQGATPGDWAVAYPEGDLNSDGVLDALDRVLLIDLLLER